MWVSSLMWMSNDYLKRSLTAYQIARHIAYWMPLDHVSMGLPTQSSMELRPCITDCTRMYPWILF